MTTPAETRPERRTHRRRLAAILTALGVLLAAGAYTAACALAPIPAPEVELAGDAERVIEADDAPALAALEAAAGPTAVGWLDDERVWANTEEPLPIASISKLVTALVGLERQPLGGGADGVEGARDEGPVHVWTEADRQRQGEYLAQDGVVFPIPVGSEVSARQMLTLALVPSANDFAAAYAYAVFGDNEAFLAAVDDWKQRHGIESLVLAEPTGLDEGNAASPADVLRITRLALRHPVIAEIVAMPQAELPWGIGTVKSTNPLFGRVPDVLGAKTGRTSVAGYNLAAAQGGTAGERRVVKLAAVLGRETASDRRSSTIAVLSALDAAARPFEAVGEGERLGTAVTVDGQRVPLIAQREASVVLLPGERVTRIAELVPVEPGPAGRAAGSVRLESPDGSDEVRVVTGLAFEEPDLLWRLTHPVELLRR